MNIAILKRICFWFVFALIVIVALTWGVDKILPQQGISRVGLCDKTEHECQVSLPGEQAPATLTFPDGIHVDSAMPVSLTLPQDLADQTQSVRFTLSCKETYMGVSTLLLSQKPEPNKWLGNIRLPKADSKVTWQVQATLIAADGKEQDIWFEFDVASSGTLTPTTDS